MGGVLSHMRPIVRFVLYYDVGCICLNGIQGMYGVLPSFRNFVRGYVSYFG